MKKRKFFSNSGILKWKMPLLISILFWMSLPGTAEAEVQLRFHLAPVGKCFVERGAFTDRRGKRLFIFL